MADFIEIKDLLNKDIDESRQGQVYVDKEPVVESNGKTFYIESYGCQMNFSDSEIVASILKNEGYTVAVDHRSADLILLNTCAIRDNAEQRVRNRLKELAHVKKDKPDALIGMLGCMAERLKTKLLEEEKMVDIVVGPDAYRELPGLVMEATTGQKAVNVLLSREETYADISPVRLGGNGVSAFISIMRGCDNMCSFCVVPFTRGRERSRDPKSIISEATDLISKGYKEVTLLGQNVDSYLWFGGGPKMDFKKLTKEQQDKSLNFSQLLEMVAQVDPDLRVRFSTSHPKDITDDVLHSIGKYPNICNYIHLPVQSGSSKVLKEMNRTYDRDWYIGKIDRIRELLPDCAISTDVISGFCNETEPEHKETLSVMEYVKYEMAYMFIYSERPGTQAQKNLSDNIPEEEKKRRLSEIVALQQEHSLVRNKQDIGKEQVVLVEGNSKRSTDDWAGRNDQNKMVVFPKNGEKIKPGDYVKVLIQDCTAATLKGKGLKRLEHLTI
ncbi:MAG: tRNA (N6-isopentenyl adenosine(37)-C2)-methylthiotransferase MiaB [Bacteroidetes bacterium]|nr:tRNA (N6-isopentenyl adenosine(37)-C2)-methylthiotransferase MiaB [Bacteroidota bacterium]